MNRRRAVIGLVAGAATIFGLAVTIPMSQAAEQAPADAVTRLIVGYAPGAAEARSDSAAAVALDDRNLAFARRLGTGAVLVDLGRPLAGSALDAVVRAFRADPDVAYVQPDIRFYAAAEPTDPQYSRQWHYSEAKAGINAPGAWQSSTGAGVTVAVIDTGRTRHSDLDANTVAGYDMISDSTAARDNNGRDSDPADQGDWFSAGECGQQRNVNSSWHGTHVAGTIAAAANNDTGGAGVAYDAKIQHVRVLGKCGGSFSDIIDGIVWASGGSVPGTSANQTPAQVLNLSLGGASSCSQAMQSAINGAVGRGSAVVVAAGNSNQNARDFTPANCANVITVAALDRDGNRSQFNSSNTAGSNYGTSVDVAAPGGETWTGSGGVNGIYSTLNSGTTTPGSESYAFYQGTSMAAPHVAGIAALVRAEHDLTPAELEAALKEHSRPIPGTCSEGCGAGLVDADATLDALGGDQPGDTVSVTNPGNQSSKVGDSVSLQIRGESSAGASLTYSATGLPSGLSISASGLITGKPTAAGSSSVRVTATDGAQNSGSTSFTWTVTDSGQGGTVTLTKPYDQMGFRGWAIQPLQISGTSTAGGALTYTAAGLPPGLTISSSGRITGTPTTAGAFTVTVTGRDSGGSTGTTSFLWRVY